MKVGFYGHVRQYNNIEAEIDANIADVLQSGKYVMGPMLARFEKEFADTGVKIAFCVAQTDEAACEFDLGAQKRHEREALERLKRLDS